VELVIHLEEIAHHGFSVGHGNKSLTGIRAKKPENMPALVGHEVMDFLVMIFTIENPMSRITLPRHL